MSSDSSQADSAGSIPVTRSTREKRCRTTQLGIIVHCETAPAKTRIGTRAIRRAIVRLDIFESCSQGLGQGRERRPGGKSFGAPRIPT